MKKYLLFLIVLFISIFYFTFFNCSQGIDTQAIYDEIEQITWFAVGAENEHSVNFQNSWVNFSDAYDSLQYGQDATGFTNIIGKVKSGANSSVIFTLPEGYRPAKDTDYYAVGNNNTAVITIKSTGEVSVFFVSDAGTDNWVSFGNIRFWNN